MTVKLVCEQVVSTWPNKCGRPAKYIYQNGVYSIPLCGMHSKTKRRLHPERVTPIKPPRKQD